MTTEKKQLLLKDLCARLPYGVKMWFPSVIAPIVLDEFVLSVARRRDEEFKPYLRPMSSMTEEERKEFIKCAGYEIEESVNGRHYEYFLKDFCGTPDNPSVNADGVDWLIKNHFDYRGLIPMDLALPAKDGMYKGK